MPRPFVSSFVSFKYNTLPSYSYYNRFYVGKLFNPNKITPFYVSQTGYSFLSNHYMG